VEITLPVRFYRAVPTSRPEGLLEEEWTLEAARTAFIELHCWNVGCEGGVPVPEDFWVFMGAPQNHDVMRRVVAHEIAPAMQAARRIGMPIVHVQPESVGRRYFHLQPPPGPPSQPAAQPHPPISDHAARRAERVHGEGYMKWEGWDGLDVADAVKPRNGDILVVTTEQLDAWLRTKGITTLLYTGFATNLCILDSPAAMKAMAGLGYRCIILREGTLAVEFPDSLADRLHTQVALRYIEAWVGYSASLLGFVKACKVA
jgi:nicotinamidase-related amidase